MIGLGSYLWNLQSGILAYISAIDINGSKTTYTVLTINGETPTQLAVDSTEVSSDGTSNWWGTAFYIGPRPANFPKLGAIIVCLYNAVVTDPPNPPLSVLDAMSLSGALLTRNEYKTVYGYLALDADPTTPIGFVASSLDGLRGMFLPIGPLTPYYDFKQIFDGNGP